MANNHQHCKKTTHQHLIDEISSKMYLSHWPLISENLIANLMKHTEILVDHFTNYPYATLSDDNKWWRRDMSWKKVWFNDQDEYHRKYDLYDNWRRQLYDIHSNVVFSLNLFAE